MKINNLKNKINKLNSQQKRELIDFLKKSYSIFNDHIKIDSCPHCKSKHFVKNGTRKGVNRFLCRDCGKSFTYKSKSVLNGIHNINLWNEFVEDFITLKISTIKEIKEKISISTQTAFNWRQKLLSALVKDQTAFEEETIEFDEAYFLISRKGRKGLKIEDKNAYRKWRRGLVGDNKYNVKIFFSYGRKSNKLNLTVNHMGRTKLENLKNYFLSNRFKDITLVTDKHTIYKSFCNQNGIEHYTFNSKEHVNNDDNTVHNQTTNAYISEFKTFVNRNLKGVSTKYLDVYANWFEFVTNIKKTIQIKLKELKFNIIDDICEDIIVDNYGIERYRQTEISFVRFLKANGRSNFGKCLNHYYNQFNDGLYRDVA